MQKPKIPFTAILLAGGDSKRMGMNKAFLRLGRERLVDIIFRKLDKLFSEVIIVADCWQEFSYLPARFTGDLLKNGQKCALRGIHAGLSLATYPSSFILGCDMPFLSLPLIRYMSHFAAGYDIVVPRLEGYYQPLFAFYNKSTLESIARQLREKKLKITGFYAYSRIKEIGEEAIKCFDPQLFSFFNVNMRDNYLLAKKLYRLPQPALALPQGCNATNNTPNTPGEGANLCHENG